MTDQTSFALAFGASAALLAYYLWRLGRRAARLEARLAELEARK